MNERLFTCYLTAAPHLFQLLELWIMITTDTSPFPSIPFPSIPFHSFSLYGVLDPSPVNSLAPMAGIAVEVWTTNAGKLPRHRNIRHLASCFIVSCQVMSCHSYHVMSCYVISYHIISYYIISYHIISYHIISYHIISYHIISYHIISYRIISYHIISYHIISCHIISYHIISYSSPLLHIVWQSSSSSTGIFFDNFVVARSLNDAFTFADATYSLKAAGDTLLHALPSHPLPPPFFTHNPFLTHTANGNYYKKCSVV